MTIKINLKTLHWLWKRYFHLGMISLSKDSFSLLTTISIINGKIIQFFLQCLEAMIMKILSENCKVQIRVCYVYKRRSQKNTYNHLWRHRSYPIHLETKEGTGRLADRDRTDTFTVIILFCTVLCGTFLVAQWFRICHPVEDTGSIPSLGRFHRAARPVCQN